MAASLKSSSMKSVTLGLGDTASGQFTCGGSLALPSKVYLDYLNKTGDWVGLTFPNLQQRDLQQLLESSTFASFGKGKKLVTDKTYRDAYALDPEKFNTSFRVSDVLGEVQSLLAPDFPEVRAELYKLNIYTGPGGCFKSHVDTPRAEDMFGSLVVCLPTWFTGGDLVLRHGEERVTYKWSSPADAPAQKVQWAAFFSDVEHEILPVTEGHRITLTYNFYHGDQQSPASGLDVSTVPFYHKLKAALGNPHFLRKGSTLGFACQHAYAGDPTKFLKGADRMVVLVAKSLGLEVNIKAVNEGCDESQYYLGEQFGFIQELDLKGETIGEDFFVGKGMTSCQEITWCQNFKHQVPSFVVSMYGNYPCCEVVYQSSAILINIPAWGDLRRALME